MERSNHQLLSCIARLLLHLSIYLCHIFEWVYLSSWHVVSVWRYIWFEVFHDRETLFQPDSKNSMIVKHCYIADSKCSTTAKHCFSLILSVPWPWNTASACFKVFHDCSITVSPVWTVLFHPDSPNPSLMTVLPMWTVLFHADSPNPSLFHDCFTSILFNMWKLRT